MTRELRDTDPNNYRLISIRTLEARLFINPSSKNRKLIGGIIARYQEYFQIKIYAYFVLSNHFHLLVKAPLGNVDSFLESVNREIARRINWKIKRRGKFWSRRYNDLKVLTEADLLNAFLYVTTNATKHGLVKDPREWPLLNSYDHAIDEKDRIFGFDHYSLVPGQIVTTTHTLTLSVLPQFEHLSKQERHKEITKLLSKRTEALVLERATKNQGFLGLEGLQKQVIGEIPQNVSLSKKPPCYSSCPIQRKAFKEERRLRADRYAEASFRFRLGDLEAQFPAFTFKPPLHRASRLVPFTPLTPDYLKAL